MPGCRPGLVLCSIKTGCTYQTGRAGQVGATAHTPCGRGVRAEPARGGCGVPVAQMSWVMWVGGASAAVSLSSSPVATRAVAWSRPPRDLDSNSWSPVQICQRFIEPFTGRQEGLSCLLSSDFSRIDSKKSEVLYQVKRSSATTRFLGSQSCHLSLSLSWQASERANRRLLV